MVQEDGVYSTGMQRDEQVGKLVMVDLGMHFDSVFNSLLYVGDGVLCQFVDSHRHEGHTKG